MKEGNKYFQDKYKELLAKWPDEANDPYIKSLASNRDLPGGVSGITDKEGYAKRDLVRTRLQAELEKLLENPDDESVDIALLENTLKAAQKTYTKDGKLEYAKDLFYPVSKVIFGLSLVMLASANIFLAPLCAFVFAFMFLASNSYQNGLYSELNMGFAFTTLGLGVLTILGALAFSGVIFIAAPYILVPAAALEILLCVNAVIRGSLRSRESLGNVSKSLDMNMKLCKNLADNIDSADGDNKERYTRILQIAKNSFGMLTEEQRNLVSTIKNPYDKYVYQLGDFKRRLDYISNMTSEEGTKLASTQKELFDITKYNKYRVARVLIRDIPWVIINISMITIATLIALPALAAMVGLSVMVLLPVTPQLVAVIVSIAITAGIINMALRLFYTKNPKDYEKRKPGGLVVAVLSFIGESSLYVAINLSLLILLGVALVAKVLSYLPVPLLGMQMGGIFGLGSWVLKLCRALAHNIIIPANIVDSDRTISYAPNPGVKVDKTKLSFILGHNTSSVSDTKKMLQENKYGEKAYILPHFSKGWLKSFTADVLVDRYVEELYEHIRHNPDANKIKLIGRDIGGAILSSALEKILKDSRFKEVKEFELCVDNSFTSLGQVATGRGLFGFFYPALPLLSLLGWNLSPARAIKNILSEPRLNSDTEIKIYINQSKLYRKIFGKGALDEKSCFSGERVDVFTADNKGFNSFCDPQSSFTRKAPLALDGHRDSSVSGFESVSSSSFGARSKRSASGSSDDIGISFSVLSSADVYDGRARSESESSGDRDSSRSSLGN